LNEPRRDSERARIGSVCTAATSSDDNRERSSKAAPLCAPGTRASETRDNATASGAMSGGSTSACAATTACVLGAPLSLWHAAADQEVNLLYAR